MSERPHTYPGPDGPLPGTVAASLGRPAPADEARRLLESGETPRGAVERLAARYSVDDLRESKLWWVRRMPKERWDDYRAGAVLWVLEEAVKALDPMLPKR